MLSTILNMILAAFGNALAEVLRDWRRDQDLKRLGAAEAIATESARAVESQRKAAAVVAEHRTVGDTVKRMSDGTF